MHFFSNPHDAHSDLPFKLYVPPFEKYHPVVNFNSCRNYEITSSLMDLVSIAIIEGGSRIVPCMILA